MEFCLTNKTIPPKFTQIKEAVSDVYLIFSCVFQEENGKEGTKATEASVMVWHNMYVLYTAPADCGRDGAPTPADVPFHLYCFMLATVHLGFSNYETSVVI